MARGSLFELHTQLEIARRVNLLKPEAYDPLIVRMVQIGVGINRFIRKLNASMPKRLKS